MEPNFSLGLLLVFIVLCILFRFFSFWFTHIVLSYRSNKVQDLMMQQAMLNVHLLHHQYVFTRIPKSVAQILDNIYHLIHVLLFFYHDITTLDLCLS